MIETSTKKRGSRPRRHSWHLLTVRNESSRHVGSDRGHDASKCQPDRRTMSRRECLSAFTDSERPRPSLVAGKSFGSRHGAAPVWLQCCITSQTPPARSVVASSTAHRFSPAQRANDPYYRDHLHVINRHQMRAGSGSELARPSRGVGDPKAWREGRCFLSVLHVEVRGQRSIATCNVSILRTPTGTVSVGLTLLGTAVLDAWETDMYCSIWLAWPQH